MNRAMLTFGTGDHGDLLDIALPGFEAYADRHGYDLYTRPPRMLTRPPSWGKIPAILTALAKGYEEVLWVDCDVVILDGTADVADDVPPGFWHAITMLHTWEGTIPSCGVWVVRPALHPALETMWGLTRYEHHPWWEQAALHDVLGYGGMPVRLLERKPLLDHTYWLDPGWNSLRLEYPDGPRQDGRFVHCAPGSRVAYRAQVMRELTARDYAQKGT